MKLKRSVFFTLLCCIAVAAASAEEPQWKLDGQSLWSREKDAATLTVEDGVYIVKHTGSRDWAVTLHDNIPVTPGDAFRISFKIENEGPGSVGFTVGMFDGEKKIITWTQGNANQSGKCAAKTLTHEFVIPWAGVTILPRLTGGGVTTARCSEFKLEKLDKVTLLEPEREIPSAGTPVQLVPPKGEAFGKYLYFKGKTSFKNERGRIPRQWFDSGRRDGEKESWRIASLDGLDFNTLPLEPFKVKPGERYFVSLRINVDRGRPYLSFFPWSGGVMGTSAFATGTFKPSPGEESGVWCTIHAYLTIPEGVTGMIPAICSEGGAVYNIVEWTISRPTEAELNPVRKKVEGFAKERRDEIFDRGLVAVRTEKDVYLSWRLLKTDGDETGFNVFRYDAEGKETKLNEKPIKATTDFVDRNAPEGATWSVRVSTEGQRNRKLPFMYESERVTAQALPYRSIPLKEGTDTFASLAFADLDGDGKQDFVIKTPNANIDPWYLYWYQSPETYKLQAYKSDGSFLWEHDLGWGIERGIWFSPYVVADVDGDGCAEVILKTCPGDFRNTYGRVYDGPEHLSILDGKTGKERCRIDWPERAGLAYNLSNRHQLDVAYLDGKTPCIMVMRGTYSRMTAVAYQMLTGPDRLEELWRWDNRWDRELRRWGQGAHTTHVVDLDGDGRDEVVLGSIVLDDDGSVLWEQKLGHPDHVYVGDIDPSRDGLEVVYGIESRNPKDSICMVDGKTGQRLWGLDQPSRHIHATGMVSDIDPEHPGCETWSGEENSEADRWLRSAKGEYLTVPEKFPRQSLSPRSIWWTAEPQRKLIMGDQPVDYPSFKPSGNVKFEGSVKLIADLYGDWREEIVTSVKGEIRIYSTTIPAKDRRTTFLQDRNYRATMVEASMGYPQIPLPSKDLKKTAR